MVAGRIKMIWRGRVLAIHPHMPGWYPTPSPQAAAFTFVHAFVVSCLGYCSAIYEGLLTCQLRCLDRVLRTAARLVVRITRFGRVSGYMRDVLHWLP